MTEQEQAPPGIDTTVPSMARVYDYFLGGKDNFAVDRAVAQQAMAASPSIRELALANRRFLSRAVRFFVDAGIRQFLDLGAGLPTQENVHQVALRHAPDSRVVYVDIDPIVLAHGRALLADNPQTAVIGGDVRDPEAVLSDPVLTRHLDFDRPVAVLMFALLHFITEDAEALAIVSAFRKRLVPGSGMAISHASPGDLTEEEIRAASETYAKNRGATATLRTREQLAAFCAGMTLAEPGIVPVDDWRPDPDEPRFPRAHGVDALGLVALVP